LLVVTHVALERTRRIARLGMKLCEQRLDLDRIWSRIRREPCPYARDAATENREFVDDLGKVEALAEARRRV
jgi:hypothetical protein